MEKVAVATSVIALILLAALGGTGVNAKDYYEAWAKIENGILYLESPFMDARINLTAGASITYLSLLNETILNCNASESVLPGFHISTFTPHNFHNGSISSLASGPWSAEIVENNSDVVVVKLTPSPTALQDIEPLNVEMYLIVTAYKPVVYYEIIFKNPTETNVSLEALILGGQQLSIDLLFNTCPTNSKTWSFVAAYGNATNPHVYRLQGSNETVYSNILPSNATLLGAALVESVNGAIGRILFVSGHIDYYMAWLPPAGPLTLHAYKARAVIEPGGELPLSVEVGVLPFNAALLDKAGIGDFAYALDKTNYMKESLDEATHYELVSKLNATISQLNESLNTYNASLSKCEDDKSKLQSELGEFKELLDTCQVNLNITKNDLSSEARMVKSAALKVVAFTLVGIIVGAAGGYTVALTRMQQAPPPRGRGIRKG